jgi:hypothetical protein
MDQFVGHGKIARTLRELQASAQRSRLLRTPDSLQRVTPNGTFLRPKVPPQSQPAAAGTSRAVVVFL